MKEYLIVRVWDTIFKYLEYISLYVLIRRLLFGDKQSREEDRSKDDKIYQFFDIWGLGNFLISIILLKVCSAPALQWWELICIVYGGFRVFEIIIYQINVILFYRYRGVLENLASYTRSIVHIIQNYAETIFWFALFYRNLEWAFDTKGISLNHVFTSLKLSFSTMTNFTPTEISPLGALANIFTFSQSVIGLTMTLLVLTWFISLLPKPGTLDEREETDNI